MSIIEFLEARITEDEVSATLREYHREGCDAIPYGDYSYPCDCGLPERMAAECAAKRAIIALDEYAEGSYWDTLACLAAVYKGHLDYRQEWAP